MSRTGPAEVTWFDVEPGALLHVANAFVDADGRIVVHGHRYDRAGWQSSWKWWTGEPGYDTTPVTGVTAYEWTLDPATGKAAEQPADDLVTEFPAIDNRFAGLENRHSYALQVPGSGRETYGIVAYDHKTRGRQVHDASPGRMPGEPCFVPARRSATDDHGYLLSLVSDLRRNASELIILDASDVSGAPVAVVELPRRVPGGSHGSWIADSALADSEAPRPSRADANHHHLMTPRRR